MKIIAGLGNPGAVYARTRHNIGFRAIDRLADVHRIPVARRRFSASCGTGQIDSHPVVLLKPLTFMNRSGEAVKKAVDFFHVGVEDLIVIHDDLDLAFGRLRIKQKGGDGGHQGIRSIIECLGGGDFLRLKIGIGRPPPGVEAAAYVLSPFDDGEERSALDSVLSTAAEALQVIIAEGIGIAMNRFQKRRETSVQNAE